MDISNEIQNVIGQPESSTLEYKAVLPPSRNIAQLIAAFANSEGGYIVLGVSESNSGKIEINGLSEDFHANSITHKALDLLTPVPVIYYQYVSYGGKKLYAIKIGKSDIPISIEDKIYKRVGGSIKLLNPQNIDFKPNGYGRIKAMNLQLESFKNTSTNSQYKLIEHYQSILKICDDLSGILYPIRPEAPTDIQEGRILSRILFTSIVDNFETYLSDLLYEIFLANPATLKSQQQVTIEEVLNCTDLQEFVKYWAKQKIGKLQKGSVKGFIKENKQISQLEVLDDSSQNEIEKILQIRHLYSHRNGVVDEKFLQFFAGQYVLNSEHQMSISEVCDKLQYLAEIVTRIDQTASSKFKLALVNHL
jgi:hypothetical protein